MVFEGKIEAAFFFNLDKHARCIERPKYAKHVAWVCDCCPTHSMHAETATSVDPAEHG